MKKITLLLPTLCLLLVWALVSCKNKNIYYEMPSGKELDIAYKKLLEQNDLAKDSAVHFLEIGSHFVIYPGNKPEHNQASVYIIVDQEEKGMYRYIYNMTVDKFDSYTVNSTDSSGVLFSPQIFPSFERLDAERDSLLKTADIAHPKIVHLRFYPNRVSHKPELGAMIEDVDKPYNSKTVVLDVD